MNRVVDIFFLADRRTRTNCRPGRVS